LVVQFLNRRPIGGDHQQLAVLLPDGEGLPLGDLDEQPIRIELADADLLDQRNLAQAVPHLGEVEEKPDKIRRDVNYAKGVSDLLVKHKVIAADDNTIVRKIVMEWSPSVSGVRITISPVATASSAIQETRG
jgi:hypothetical protein